MGKCSRPKSSVWPSGWLGVHSKSLNRPFKTFRISSNSTSEIILFPDSNWHCFPRHLNPLRCKAAQTHTASLPRLSRSFFNFAPSTFLILA